MARRATALLASGERLLLADLVLAECVFVLESFYEVERSQVAALMRAAIALPAVETLDPAALLRALEVYEVDRRDFADAYLVAQAEATGVGKIVSLTAASTALSASRGAKPDDRCSGEAIVSSGRSGLLLLVRSGSRAAEARRL